jgi:hypothetical protein
VENADPPTTWFHPDSLEAVTKVPNNGIKMGDKIRLNPKHQCSQSSKHYYMKENIKISAKDSLGLY